MYGSDLSLFRPSTAVISTYLSLSITPYPSTEETTLHVLLLLTAHSPILVSVYPNPSSSASSLA